MTVERFDLGLDGLDISDDGDYINYADYQKLEAKLDQILGWCKAYHHVVIAEPDWNVVREKLGDTLLSQVSCSNMRRVVDGISKIIEGERNEKQ